MCFVNKNHTYSVASEPITCYKIMKMYVSKYGKRGNPLNSCHYPRETHYHVGDTIEAAWNYDVNFINSMDRLKGEVVHAYDYDAMIPYNTELSLEQGIAASTCNGIYYHVAVRCEIPKGTAYWYNRDNGEYACKSLVIKEILDWRKFYYQMNLIKTNLTHVLKWWY